MKISDVLRRLADNMDGHGQGGHPDHGIQNAAHLSAVPTGQNIVIESPDAQVPSVPQAPVRATKEISTESSDSTSPNGNTASGNAKAPRGLFLPPLQQKQELLKKAVEVENVYDDGGPEVSEETDNKQTDTDTKLDDIVDRIKKLSGIPAAKNKKALSGGPSAAVVQELSNDDIFDDQDIEL